MWTEERKGLLTSPSRSLYPPCFLVSSISTLVHIVSVVFTFVVVALLVLLTVFSQFHFCCVHMHVQHAASLRAVAVLISGLARILDVLLHASLELLAPVKPGLDTRMSSTCWPSWRKSWSWRSLAEAQPSLALSSSASLEGEIARSLSQGSRRTTN